MLTIPNIPNNDDDTPTLFFLSRRELSFWKRQGMIKKEAKYGDICLGSILTESKEITL